MKPINFSDLLTGLRCVAEEEKIILIALINSHATSENGDNAQVERVVAQTVIAAARERRKAFVKKMKPQLPHEGCATISGFAEIEIG